MFKDSTGILQEHESIMVSGAPHYMEGKMLSVTKSVDEDGDPTSTGEAQAETYKLVKPKCPIVEENSHSCKGFCQDSESGQ